MLILEDYRGCPMMMILIYLAHKRYVEEIIADMGINLPFHAEYADDGLGGGRRISFDIFGERFIWRKSSG